MRTATILRDRLRARRIREVSLLATKDIILYYYWRGKMQ